MDYPEYRAKRRTITTPHGEFAYVDVGEVCRRSSSTAPEPEKQR
jgi:hypothetical protein